MSTYLLGIILAYCGPLLYSVSNMIDSVYANHSFKHVTSINIFTGLIGILFIPIIFIIDTPTIPSWQMIAVIACAGSIEILYTYPYYYALRHADTSIVTALFALGRIMVPLLAFFVVDEQLTWWQYVGLACITLATLIIAKKPGLRINKAWGHMLFVTVLLSIQAVLYKYIFEHVNWGTGMAWTEVSIIGVLIIIVLLPGNMRRIKEDLPVARKEYKLLFGQSVADTAADFSYTYAVALIPVSIVKGIGSIQPIFVLLITFILRNTRGARFHKEDIDRGAIRKKIVAYVVIAVGSIVLSLS